VKIQKQFNCSYTDLVFFGDALTDWDATSRADVDFVVVGKENNIFKRRGLIVFVSMILKILFL